MTNPPRVPEDDAVGAAGPTPPQDGGATPAPVPAPPVAPPSQDAPADPGSGYDASNITVLEGLEAVRKRPGMYIGSTGERGLHHLVQEVVDNSVDEALAGHASHIEVTLRADGGVRVVDDGRGIPVDIIPSEGKPAVEVVLTVLHAGGKFGGGGYAVSGGLHGVGVSVVNALSSRVQVEVRRQGSVWRQSYTVGVPDAPLARGEDTEETGTTVTFWPSEDVFETVDFDFDYLRGRLQQMAFLNKGLALSLTDERQPVEDDAAESTDATEKTASAERRSVSYRYDDGLVDYVKHLNASKRGDVVHEEVIAFESENTEKLMSLEVAMQWTSTYSESVHTYANTINTHEGGTHEEGFRASLTALVNRYGRAQKIIKEKDESLTGEDVREGLTAVVSVKLGEPQFEGQTKTKLGNTEVKGFVQSLVTEQLTDWFARHPREARDIIMKAIFSSQARMAARKARDATRRKGLLESGGMPGKLKDCQSNNPEECEVFIVEGDSAGGSAVRGRDPRTQAILPIRGKILNVERARLDKALSNIEVQALITAFGTGIGEDFTLEKLRYHKIILMADADVDGQHITTLLLTLLFRYMRPLVEAGRVYLAQPPLYRVKWSNRDHDFVYSDRERDAIVAARQAEGGRLPKDGAVQRYKGLGEMNWDELARTTMDRNHRTLLRVTLDDAAAADSIFSVLMGEDVESRRDFIQRNARDVRFLDV